MDKMQQESAPATGGGAAGANGGAGGGAPAGGGTGTGGPEGSDDIHSEFYNTGRIGRRNALPDILGSHCTTTTADLPTQMGALSTSDSRPPNQSPAAGSAAMTTNPATSTAGSGGGS